MLNVHTLPDLRAPTLLCAFNGWADAAFAASGALQFLARIHRAPVVAEFDSDQLYNYTITRPATGVVAPGRRVLRWPRLEWLALRLPEDGPDLLMLRGPEPDLRWQACVEAVAAFARQAGVRQALAFGAFYATVPHSGPALLIGVCPDPALRARLHGWGIRESTYEGPTGFVTTVVDAINRSGIAAAAVWGATPSYMPGTSNPKLALAFLQVVERLIDRRLGLAELEAAGQEMERQVDEALRNRPDLADLVGRLPAEAPPQPEPPLGPQQAPAMDSEELPSAEEVLKDLEDHLRRLRDEPPEEQ